MEAFWDELRSKRLGRSLSLEAIGARSKIAERHLVALEEGRLRDLPGGIVRKGILRGYLQAVGLSPEPWMTRFEACLEELPVSDGAEGLAAFAEGVWRSRPAATRRSHALRWPGLVAILLVLVLFTWCVWQYALRGRIVISTGDGVMLRSAQSGASRKS